MQTKINLAVIAGGYSSEKEVSNKSAETILTNLDNSLYNKYLIVIEKNSWYCLINDQKIEIDKNDFSVTIDSKKINFDFAYITIHGTPGEDGKLQGYFDMLNIPYNTCGQISSSLTFNKWNCNQVLMNNGISCSKSTILRNIEQLNIDEISARIGYPCFVKPNDGGSSFGISKVKAEKGLTKAVENAFKEGDEVVIEAFLEGTEVTCGAYSMNNDVYTLPLTEIVSHNEFFDYEAKYNGLSDEITPARVSDEIKNNIQLTTKTIYKLLNLKGIIRVDYIVVNTQPYVIEVNTTPGMSAQSIIPQQVSKEDGLTLAQLLNYTINK